MKNILPYISILFLVSTISCNEEEPTVDTRFTSPLNGTVGGENWTYGQATAYIDELNNENQYTVNFYPNDETVNGCDIIGTLKAHAKVTLNSSRTYFDIPNDFTNFRYSVAFIEANTQKTLYADSGFVKIEEVTDFGISGYLEAKVMGSIENHLVGSFDAVFCP